MSRAKGCVTFGEFFHAAYDAATSDPFAGLFRDFSKTGDREGMIRIILDIPYVRDLKISESYRGKNDSRAAEVYDKARRVIAESGDEHEKESRACSILAEALFAASAGSRLFLDALLDCAKRSYDLGAFARCLKYCECMLALPSSFYDKSAESASYFSERRDECTQLERECSKRLETARSSQRKKSAGKRNGNRGPSESTSTGKCVVTVPTVEGKRHKLLENCSDAVTLQSDERRGRYLVANRNIKAGSVLIVDQPFSFNTEGEALGRNCLHCHATLMLDDSVRIPCRQCQTVSSANNFVRMCLWPFSTPSFDPATLCLAFVWPRALAPRYVIILRILQVSFCSEKCRNEAWQTYHRYECSILDFFYETDTKQQRRQTSHLLLAYRTTIAGAFARSITKSDLTSIESPFLNDDFLRYHSTRIHEGFDENETAGNDVDRPFSNLGISEVYRSCDYRTVLQLKTHCADADASINLIRAIESIFLTKCFTFILSKMDVVCSKETFVPLAVAALHHLQAINCNAYEIVENVRDDTSHVWEPRYVGGAIYPTVSLVNHSCYPNIVRHSYPSGIVVVRALRFIGKGTEILDCYGPHFLTEGRLTRREYLWKKYRFLCGCEACTENWQYPLPETINYKCRACSGAIDALVPSKRERQKVPTKQCPKCHEKIDRKKLDSQFQKSVEKRLNAITKMYEGRYEDALPLLLEHIHFIEKALATPNIETVKAQQCIIQCYNNFGCTSR